MATTYTTRKALTALLIVVAGTLLSLPRNEAVAAPAPVTGIVTENVTATDQAAYDTLVSLFETAGFELPVFQVGFHHTKDACQGYMGLHQLTPEGISRIDVCATNPSEMVQEAHRFRTLIHEVAHAWVEQNISDETKTEFMSLRGAETWSDTTTEWKDRGAEHSAEVLAWGLQDGDYNISIVMDGRTDAELATAYELLTK